MLCTPQLECGSLDRSDKVVFFQYEPPLGIEPRLSDYETDVLAINTIKALTGTNGDFVFFNVPMRMAGFEPTNTPS